MKPIVTTYFREEVENYVAEGFVYRPSTNEFVPRGILYSGEKFRSVTSDIAHYRRQVKELEFRSMPSLAALFKDEEPGGEEFPILLQVPDFENFAESYSTLEYWLKESQVKVVHVTPLEAESIFVDRMAEFLAVSSTAGSSTPADTIVRSNRKGDTIVYAKGYFTSTGTAFGISTPANKQLPAGRYSFGIVDSGSHRFENVMWSCPTTVKLNLP